MAFGLAPFLVRELFDNPPDSLYDQNFGLGINEILPCNMASLMSSVPLRSGYLRPCRTRTAAESGISNVSHGKDGFKINLDVQQFKPEELKVKVVNDFVIVEGSHEERQDEHGFISRQFVRKYKIPENVDSAGLNSKLSSDGVLTLEAPIKATAEKEREITIIHSNHPVLMRKEEKKPVTESMEN